MSPLSSRIALALAFGGLALAGCDQAGHAAQAQAAPEPGSAARGGSAMPSGRYVCLFAGGGSPGAVDIQGSTYRGPSLETSGPFAPYAMGPDNSVTWTAGFGAFNVASTQYRGVSNDSAHQPWFTVTYNRTTGGGVDAVDCQKE
jgi:hypothetical protein